MVTKPLSDRDRMPLRSASAPALVICDDPLHAQLYNRALTRFVPVLMSGDGETGFYRAIDRQPCLAILDVRFEGWSAEATVRSFSQHESLREIPVIAAVSEASEIVPMITTGAVDTICRRTFAEDGIQAVIRKQLDRLTLQS